MYDYINRKKQSLEGNMSREQLVQLLQQKEQLGLLAYYDRLDQEGKCHFIQQLEDVDWDLIECLKKKEETVLRGKIAPLKAMTDRDIRINSKQYDETGLEAIRAGKVAAVLLAGGQGSRLGYDGPKGTVDIGETKSVYIFELLFYHLLKVTKRAGAYIPFYIMTSEKNHEETMRFLKEHNFFGYPAEYVTFFTQAMAPCVDLDGKILMETMDRIACSPNGNGGWFRSMEKKGILHDLHARGVEWLNVFAVDNVLQQICDPTFIGAVLHAGVVSGAKVVKKADPRERVGVMCLEDGKPAIIEYYEMSEDMLFEVDDSGEYAYNYGVILNYLFRVDRLESILERKMPVHFAQKKIPYTNADGTYVVPEQPNGYKFEEFILDMIHMLDDCLPYEVIREKEFAPIKNATGVDSIETARVLLRANGIEL